MPATSPDFYQARILVADDQQTNRKLAIFFLKNAGFKVFAEAANGEETLAQVQQFKPDIILLDILMPEPNGFEVCKKLKSNPLTATIPVLFMSGLTDIKNRTLGYQLGAVDYVHKPIDRFEMCARVNVHLQNSLLTQSLQQYKTRLSHEMNQARDLQLSLLPQPDQVTLFTKEYPFNINHHFTSSSELSGDYWGLFRTQDHLAVMTLDFTGHGVAAAMNSLRSHAMILELQHLLPQPMVFMKALNARLKKLLPVGQFATCALVLVNKAGEGTALVAGCPPLALYNASKKTYTWMTGQGTPLGAASASRFVAGEHSFKLNKGDSLLLYSDSLTETLHKDGKRWTSTQLQKKLGSLGKAAGHKPLDDITADFYATAQKPLVDDLTLVEIKYTGKK